MRSPFLRYAWITFKECTESSFCRNVA